MTPDCFSCPLTSFQDMLCSVRLHLQQQLEFKGPGGERGKGERLCFLLIILDKMRHRQYSLFLSACRQEHRDPYIYVHVGIMSVHQHKSRTSPSLLSFIVLQYHNYCICLAHCCLIYDVGLYLAALLMYYSSPLTLTVSAVHVFLYHPLIHPLLMAQYSFSTLSPLLLIHFILCTQCLMLHLS